MPLKEKTINPIFKATAKAGHLLFENPDDFRAYLSNFEDKKMDVIVKREVKHRSRQEEKYYHGVVCKLVAKAMFIEPQQAHEFMKDLFLKIEERTPSGFRYERVLSTIELSDVAYREYWQACQRWASLPTLAGGLNIGSGLELNIPSPNEVDYENF